MLVANRSDEALALYGDLAASFPEDLFFVGAYGATAARLGDRQTALQVTQRLDELTDPQWFGADHYLHANLAAGIGKREEAVEYLHATLRAGFQYHPSFHRVYFLEPLWGYEPFEEFLRPKE
jgi:tetratricopeptide (TPR) repeat protein